MILLDLFYEFVDVEFTICVLIIIIMYMRLDTLKSAIILLHLLAIFVLNGVLFPENYFIDQHSYLKMAQGFRASFDFSFPFQHGKKIGLTSLIFGIFPMPFVVSVRSVAMINFLLYLFIFVFIRKKLSINNHVDFFFLLYPSLLLYSSLALRDTLILGFMFLSIHYLVFRQKYLFGFLLSVPLVILKVQNFLMIYLTLYLSVIMFKKFSRLKMAVSIVLPIIAVMAFGQIQIARFNLAQYFTLEKLEFYRFALFADSYNYNYDLVNTLNYYPITGMLSFLKLGSLSVFSMLLKPLPWQASNLFQIIQSFENIVIFIVILYLFFQKCNIPQLNYKYAFLKIFILISSSINGIVIFNYGTLARARFIFVVIYVVFSIILLHSDRILSAQIISKNKSQ